MNPGTPPRSSAVLPLAALCSTAFAASLQAETIREDSFAITPGWNLIHIASEPLETDPREALAGIDWDSLWTWLPPAGGPASTRTDGRWVVVYRSAPKFLNTLHGFSGPAPYVLLAKSGGTLRVRGAWRPNRSGIGGGRFELFGPTLPAGAPPSLAAYFSRPGVRESVGPIFEFSGGSYRRVNDGTSLRPGAAYWVRAAQEVPEPDPVRVDAGFGGLRFDAQTSLQEFEIEVGESAAPRQLSLKARASADGISTTAWIEVQKGDGSFAAIGTGATLEVPPGQTNLRVALRARQEDLTETSLAFQAAVLQVDAPNGSAEVGLELEAPTLQGIWIGEAAINEVERMSAYGTGYSPAPSLPLSLILEVPQAGQPRLLPCLEVEGNRDGKNITVRFEAALFHEKVNLTGALGSQGASGTLSSTISLQANHPLNPYRHRYHPEHTAGYDITRSLKLRFGAQGSGQLPESPFATVGILSGVYEEDLSGLAQEPIRVRGHFRLRKLAGGTATPCSAPGQ